MKEIFKEVKGYEGVYDISNMGRLKSLKAGRILKQTVGTSGYCHVTLCINCIKYTVDIHKLVAIAFLGHTPCGFKLVVNHIDFNKTNNNVKNLEIVTSRENLNQKHRISSSIYTGVCLSKSKKRWVASIVINKKSVYLGSYKIEYDAHLAYEEKLKQISFIKEGDNV
jgi:hypothetical protein